MALEKAIITNTVTGERIPVMFNPEEYTVNREINYAQTAIPGLSGPILQFVNGNMQTLEMELFLDSYEEHRVADRVQNQAGEDVRRLTRQVTDLMNIQPSTHAPPVLLFIWASLSFTCVLARAVQQFTMFRPDGTPVRAKLQVTFNEFRNVDFEAKEIKRETADFSKVHLVSQGDTLSTIAAAEYRNPKLWRPIALRNRIDDPRSLPVGARLIIPRLPYRDPGSGKVYQ
jgi:contractile injection system tube protein/LysM domain-containing protein